MNGIAVVVVVFVVFIPEKLMLGRAYGAGWRDVDGEGRVEY